MKAVRFFFSFLGYSKGQKMNNLPCFMLERFWELDREFGRK